MTETNIYGFNSTDEVKLDAQGLPVGTHKAMIIGEEPDAKGRGVIVEYEVVDGEDKGKRGKVWYLTLHENPQTSAIAKQSLRRIADATGRAVSQESPLKGRVLTIEVGVQKNDANRTEIKRYLPENAASASDVPA